MLDIRAGFAKRGAATRDELAFRAARITETELSDVEAAISRYQGILAATPDHAGHAARRCGRSRAATTTACPRSTALEPILRAAQRLGQVVELLELRLAVEDAVERRLALLGEIARIEERSGATSSSAFATWARALTEEATEAAPRQALERLAAATRRLEAASPTVYEERMDATFDASLQRSLALRLAALYEKRAGAISGRAGRVPAQGAVAAGRRGAGAGVAGGVLRRQGENAELAEILAREAEVASEPGEQADFLAALGEVRLRALEDADGALAAFRDAHRPQPGARRRARAR